MQINWTILLLAAIIPMIVGFIWYHPALFGNAWMKACGLTEEKMKGGNMVMIFGLSFVFAFLIAMTLQMIVIHQYHVFSILVDEPNFTDPTSEAGLYYKNFMDTYGNNFRTFKHGSFHGFLFGLLFLLPVIATGALFERKGGKYIWINGGYWIVTLTLMGGVICAFA